jgi:hypothetical protein
MKGGYALSLMFGIFFLVVVINFNKTGDIQGDFIFLSGKRSKDPYMFWVINIFYSMLAIVLLIISAIGMFLT